MTWEDRPGNPIDWWRVDRQLCETYGYTPQQIDDLTISEILMLMDDPSAARPHGGRGMSMTDAEIRAGVTRWAQMTPRERLQQAMRDDE